MSLQRFRFLYYEYCDDYCGFPRRMRGASDDDGVVIHYRDFARLNCRKFQRALFPGHIFRSREVDNYSASQHTAISFSNAE